MVNKSENKVKMPELDVEKRAQCFEEVALGYTEEQALEEANRCLGCKAKPCEAGCPVGVKIPEFIALCQEGKFIEAYDKITETNALPAICGRVCPQENQCESLCVRAKKGESVGIGRLERFCADYAMTHGHKNTKAVEKNGIKAAIIGSGPAGITCAAELAKRGYDVTVFEAFHTAGGVLKYGIPEFRLPKALVDEELKTLSELGVEVQTNVVIGKTLTIDDLNAQGYDAIFIGTGAGLPKFLGVPGENMNGVYSANEFLTRVNLMRAWDFPNADTPVKRAPNVAVLGAGNVAMDAARVAKRLGAEHVYLIYRRSRKEMPARLEEIEHAEEEGVEFNFLMTPIEVLGENGQVTGLKCLRMELGEPDESGRRRPVPIPGSDFIFKTDAVISALGQSPNPLLKKATPGLETQRWGGIITLDESGRTSIDGVWAGGDAVTGAATVILAMGAGKEAAAAMDEYMKQKKA